MAKKRKEKEPEVDDTDIELPGFDEKEFIEEENKSAKTSYIAIGLGFLGGLLDALVIIFTGQWIIGGILVLVSAGGFYPLFKLLKIDIRSMKIKNWAGMAIFFLLTALLINVVILQPPIIDIAPARADQLMLYYEDDVGNYTTVYDATGANTIYIQPNATYNNVTFVVRVRDNVAVDDLSLHMMRYSDTDGAYQEIFSTDMNSFDPASYPFDNITKDEHHDDWEKFRESYHCYDLDQNFTMTRGNYRLDVRAVDHSGRVTVRSIEFRIRPSQL